MFNPNHKTGEVTFFDIFFMYIFIVIQLNFEDICALGVIKLTYFLSKLEYDYNNPRRQYTLILNLTFAIFMLKFVYSSLFSSF